MNFPVRNIQNSHKPQTCLSNLQSPTPKAWYKYNSNTNNNNKINFNKNLKKKKGECNNYSVSHTIILNIKKIKD